MLCGVIVTNRNNNCNSKRFGVNNFEILKSYKFFWEIKCGCLTFIRFSYSTVHQCVTVCTAVMSEVCMYKQ